MLGWIAGWFGRFAGAVDSTVVRMVHWVVHALASVVYTVFAHVGAAWRDMYAAGNWLRESAGRFVGAVYDHIRAILLYWVPRIFGWIDAVYHRAISAVEHLARLAWGWVRALESDVQRWILALYHWAWQHVYLPLRAYADWLWARIKAWAYVAYWWITHPAKLAELLLWPLVAALEAAAWDVARVLGTFTTALIVRNVRRVAQLIETVLAAVL